MSTTPLSRGELYGAGAPFFINQLGERLRRLAARSLTNNRATVTPLTQPPAWAINTTYTAGDMGSVVQAGGNMYALFSSSGGTTASSGSGPSSTDPTQPVTDNTCSWVYLGPVQPSSNAFDIPALSYYTSTPSGLSNGYVAGTNDSAFTYQSAQYWVYSSSLQGALGISSHIGSSNVGNIGTGVNGTFRKVSFMSDAPAVAISTVATPQVKIYINDVPLTTGAQKIGSGSGVGGVKLDFSSTGGARVRKYTIEFALGSKFNGVYVATGYRVWPVADSDQVRVVFLGDSYCAGGGGFPITVSRTWPQEAADRLGWSDCVTSGVGGTGLWATGPSQLNPTYGGRAAQDLFGQSVIVPSGMTTIVPYKAPDVIVVMGSVNDNGRTISNATNATPIVCTTTIAHNGADGNKVLVSSVNGNTAANGTYYMKVTGYSSTTFGLYSDAALTTPVSGNAAYTNGGKLLVYGQAGTAMKALYNAIRAVYSSVPIIVTGVFTPNILSTDLATYIAVETEEKAALPLTTDPYLFYMPISTDASGRWLSGTGNTGFGGAYTAGDGDINTRYITGDKTHPTERCMQYIADRFANWFRLNVLPKL